MAKSLSKEENDTLELLMFARVSKKNVSTADQSFSWFSYGSFFNDYQRGCQGIKVHSSNRFFDPATGQVWIPRENLMIKICDRNFEDFDGKVYASNKSACNFLDNPLCSNLLFKIRKSKVKESKQPPWEFSTSLKSRGIEVDVSSTKKAKDVYHQHFET